jgi:hypothetical protein
LEIRKGLKGDNTRPIPTKDRDIWSGMMRNSRSVNVETNKPKQKK